MPEGDGGDLQEPGQVNAQVGPEAKGRGEMAQSPGGAEGWALGPHRMEDGPAGEGGLTREKKPQSLIRAGGVGVDGEQMVSLGPFTGADPHQPWF